ncbi:MAG: type II toxin-antitoxin system prevent-host-death family antitoxin [Actinobacteria bacterium]|nr:MAG: type II toxin-antitoxin system prevent-host-death family antitoxin [Actinomycetota bacterium]
MRFVSVRDLRAKSAEILRELPDEGEVVVTSHGKPVALMIPVDEADLERTLDSWRRGRAMLAIVRTQLDSVARGTDKMTMEEIDALIAEVRRERSS